MATKQGADSAQLVDRVILITGAAGAIGSAVARSVAEQGGQLILAGRKVPPLEALYDHLVDSGAATPAIFPIDLSGAAPEDYAQMAVHIEREFGRLDAVVHTAAAFDALSPLEQTAADKWLAAMQVNLSAPFLINQAVLPLLRQRDDARVVLTLDDENRVGQAYWGAYGVAKFALRGLLSISALELERSGVRVVGIIPPPTRSALRARAYMQDQQGGEAAEAVPLYMRALCDIEIDCGRVLSGL